MKKHFFLLSLLLSFILGIGQMWGAADVTYDFTGSGWTVSSGTLSNGTVSFTGSGTNFKMNSGYFYMGKSGAYINFPTYASAVEKIVVTGNSGASSSVVQNIFVGDNAVSTATTGATGTNTYNIASGYQAAGTTYTLKVTSNHNTQVTKIEVFFVSATPTCATPTFDPEGGEFSSNSIDVEIATTTDGATIYYTTDGTNPTTSSSVYSSALNLTETTTVKAIAVKEGASNSAVASATYTKVAPFAGSVLEITKTDFTTVSYDDNAGDHEKDDVTFTTAKVYQSGGGIQFQKTNGLLYNKTDLGEIAKIEITKVSGKSNNLVVYAGTEENPSTTVVAGNTSGDVTTHTFASGNGYFAIKCNGTGASNVDPIKIYYTAPAVATPTISGETPFLSSTSVSISGPEGATVYYTTDDSDPKTSNTKITYSAAFTLTATTTVKAAAKVGNDWSSVASKEFTKLTTITVAEAIALIPEQDNTADDKYVSGIVCTEGTAVSSGKMTYYISDDGSETTRLQIYKGKNLNNTNFSATTDLAAGDRVVVFGQLKNFKGTYEMNEGNYLVLKQDPVVAAPAFTPNGGGFMGEADVTITCATASNTIYYTLDGTTPSKSSTQYTAAIHLTETKTIKAIAYVGDEHSVVVAKTFTYTSPMTVAEALTALDSESPINNAAVTGIISTAPTSNPSSGRLTYYISDDGTDTDQLEVYQGFGLNGAAFSAKTDLQVGDEVTVFGNLKIYKETKEFDTGNRLLTFRRPEVNVTGVELDQTTLRIKVGATTTLTATVNPENATNQNVTWSTSNEAIATVTNGEVTAVAIGTATITVTTEDGNFTATCAVTVTDPNARDGELAAFKKVTATGDITDGQYLIVYEGENNAVAFDAALETLDVANNTIEVTIEGNMIVTYDDAAFTIDVTAGTIKSYSGKYIGATGYSNGLSSSTSNAYEHQNISIDGGNAIIYFQQESWNSNKNGKMQLCYNSDANQRRFRYYKEGSQKAIQLYKKIEPESIRETVAGSWGTFCSAQKVLVPSGASFFTIAYVNMQGGVPVKVYFDEIGEGESLQAGQPYVYIAHDNAITGVLSGNAVAQGINDHGFVGVLSEFDFQVQEGDGSRDKYYVIYGNQIRLCGDGYFKLLAGRAYIDAKDANLPTREVAAPAPGRRRIGLDNPAAPQVTTDIEATQATGKAVKMMIGEQLFILRDGKLYDTTGRFITNMQ